MIIGVCLCVYFTYHVFQGQRSITRLYTLNKNIEMMSDKYVNVKEERQSIEERVVMLRPNTLNRRFLEERVRLVLGYKHADDVVIVHN